LDGDGISLDDVDVGKDLTDFMSSPHFSTESHPPDEVIQHSQVSALIQESAEKLNHGFRHTFVG
jgi:hypothetical protein